MKSINLIPKECSKCKRLATHFFLRFNYWGSGQLSFLCDYHAKIAEEINFKG